MDDNAPLYLRIIAPNGDVLLRYSWAAAGRFVWHSGEAMMLPAGTLIVVENKPSEWIGTCNGGIGLKVR